MPSTANFLIDSADALTSTNPQAYSIASFSITKPAALLNGYFTRLAVSEVVLDWGDPNVSTSIGNTDITLIRTSGAVSVTSTLANGNYTVADVLNTIVADCSGVITGLAVTGVGANCRLTATTAFSIVAGTLSANLGISLASSLSHPIRNPNPNAALRYLDLVCNDLTYNQDLKDASTGPSVGDIVVRWYFAWDTPPSLDQYGFPIQMGYLPFKCRRAFAFPKQIRWTNNQPIGNLSFETYQNSASTANKPYVPSQFGSYWMLTLLVSEV